MEDYTNEHWHQELCKVAQRLSRKQLAERLDCSSTQVSQVVNGKYAAHRIHTFKEKFEGAFMGYCVNCPVAGELPRDRCIEFQNRQFCATNPTRVQLYHACRSGCEHSRIPLKNVDKDISREAV